MRISSASLPDHLEPGSYELRTETFSLLNSQVPYAEAVAMAYRGEVEGIATSSGRVKYLRQLSQDERAESDCVVPQIIEVGGSTVFARTHLGVYREPVRQVTVEEYLGFRVAVSSGEIVGRVYAHCGLR